MKILLLLSITSIITIEEYFKNGVYNLFLDNNHFLIFEEKLQISISEKGDRKSNFRLRKLNNAEYYIEFAKNNLKLSLSNENIELSSDDNNENTIWSFVKTDDKKYIIKNKKNCYISLNIDTINCKDSNLKRAAKFNIEKIYEEINHTPEDIKLIEKNQLIL